MNNWRYGNRDVDAVPSKQKISKHKRVTELLFHPKMATKFRPVSNSKTYNNAVIELPHSQYSVICWLQLQHEISFVSAKQISTKEDEQKPCASRPQGAQCRLCALRAINVSDKLSATVNKKPQNWNILILFTANVLLARGLNNRVPP